jgi:hypothetical protein
MYGYSLGIKKAPSGGGGGAIAPSNLTAPVISGTTTLGSTLTTTDGTWSGTPTPTFTYQWYRGASPISGATSTTYVTTLADSTANITCQVTATNSAGSATATSNTITLPSYAPVNTVAPVISGTAVVGQTLTTTNGTWTNSPSSYSYQWKRGATNIGTNSSTYTLVQADAGNTSNITCVVTATNSAGSANATSNQIAQILTVRTNSFLSASSISDATIRGALNTMDIGLISNSLDTKMRALYPFVGGSASTHKWNFMDARDLDAAFRLTFSGTWTHSSTGSLPNGTNAFANTFLVGSSQFNTTTFNHLSYYSRSNTAFAGEYAMGAFDGTGNHAMIIRRDTGLSFLVSDYPSGTSFRTASATIADGRGLFLGSQTGSNLKLFRNGSVIASNTAATTNAAQSTRSIYIGALNQTSIVNYTNKECAFASLGQGLSDSEVTAFNTIVTTFQTTLGRNV